jgi:predicted small integral membrane protein
LKGKAAELLLLAIVVSVILVISLDTLEDTLIKGASFAGTPLALLFNFAIALTQNVTAAVSSWGYGGIFFFDAARIELPARSK